MNTKDELIDGAVLYLRIYLLGMPALGLYNFGNAVLSAAGDTKRPLYYLAFAGVVNVILNLFFVIVCHLGVAGVALASMISQFISAFLILRALLTGKEKYCLRLSEIRFDKRKAVGILQIGIPSAFQYSLFAFANLFVQSSVNSFDHVLVEGNSAAANADPLVYDMMAAFYTACSSFIAQNFGARKKKRILQTYLICLQVIRLLWKLVLQDFPLWRFLIVPRLLWMLPLLPQEVLERQLFLLLLLLWDHAYFVSSGYIRYSPISIPSSRYTSYMYSLGESLQLRKIYISSMFIAIH